MINALTFHSTLAQAQNVQGTQGVEGTAGKRKSVQEQIDEFVKDPNIPKEAKLKTLTSYKKRATFAMCLGGTLTALFAGMTLFGVAAHSPLLMIFGALDTALVGHDAVQAYKGVQAAKKGLETVKAMPDQQQPAPAPAPAPSPPPTQP